MTDSKALACVNFYAAMGTLETYCKLDKEARELAKQKNIAIRFKIKGGPDGVLAFKDGDVTARPYKKGDKFDIGLSFPSCDDFNKMVAGGKASVLPTKGLTKIKFVLDKQSPFNVLTDKMAKIMRQTESKNDEELTLSVLLTFSAMGAAIAEIGNHDPKGMVANKHWADGEVAMIIPGVAEQYILKKNGVLTFHREPAKNPRAKFVFRNIEVTKGVIDGALDAMTCIGTGDIAMSGMCFMLDDLNKCLNLVPEYLA